MILLAPIRIREGPIELIARLIVKFVKMLKRLGASLTDELIVVRNRLKELKVVLHDSGEFFRIQSQN